MDVPVLIYVTSREGFEEGELELIDCCDKERLMFEVEVYETNRSVKSVPVYMDWMK